MQLQLYTVWAYSQKSGNITQVPGTQKMTRHEANELAHDLRLENIGRQQFAVYRGKEMRSCFALSENMKPMVTV